MKRKQNKKNAFLRRIVSKNQDSRFTLKIVENVRKNLRSSAQNVCGFI